MKIWCIDYRDSVYTDAAMLDVTQFRGLRYFDGMRLNDRFPKGCNSRSALKTASG
jgi:hypothetical protein